MPALCSSGMKPSAVWRKVIRVPPSCSFNRYCTLQTNGKEAINGPTNSSSVGLLMTCTCAQIAVPPAARPRLDLHAERPAVGGLVAGAKLLKQRSKGGIERRLDVDF